MLTLTLPKTELFNEETNEFINCKEIEIRLEHSLVSISKWEMKWHEAFLNKKNMTEEEISDYIKFMAIGNNVDDSIINRLNSEHIKQIQDYIANPMSATWFNNQNQNGPKSREVLTSELIYYYMIAYHIPFECQKWHLNRLITLIRICSLKESQRQGSNKMSKSEIYKNNTALNAQRRAKLHSKG